MTDWEDIHREAKENYERDYEKERRNIEEAYEDLRFRRGRLEDQWDPDALKARKGRPCHVINKLPQFIRQVTGDMRQMRPSIRVVPVDSRGDINTAEIRAGMIRYVENRSFAKHVYTTAADSQVTAGIGHWQILTEYSDSNTFNQEIRIAGIEDSVSVIWDADSVLPTREDAQRCFVPVDMSMSLFKKSWPKAMASGWDAHATDAFQGWGSSDFVRVAAYWMKKPMKRTLVLMPDGTVDDVTDQKEELGQVSEYLQGVGARIEERDSYKVVRYLMTAAEILEEEDWLGMHIPIVPVIGEEVRIGREVYRHGIVRYARDLQRMINYYSSAETEVVALQPKAPWIGTRKMFDNSRDQWEVANTDNLPYLEYSVDPQAPGSKPERVAPPVASQAIQNGSIKSAEDMKAVIGIYDASLGAKSNETSGVAIERRQREGDTGTFVYIDNFALAIQRTGQIINDLIPHIYDVNRQLRIIGEDGKPEAIEINKSIIVDGMERIQNDMTVGAYDVLIEQGPSYSTKRQEAKDGMAALIQAFPAAAPLLGDIYARTQDWPEAQTIGERLEELLPPAVKSKLKAEQEEAERRPGQPPKEPDPQEVAQQEAAARQQQMQQRAAELELEGKALENEKIKVEIAAKAREAGQPGEGHLPDPIAVMKAQAENASLAYESRLNEIKIASEMESLETQRRLDAIRIEMAELELHRARAGIVHGEQSHNLNMARQSRTVTHGEEKHRAAMERMKAQPERVEP